MTAKFTESAKPVVPMTKRHAAGIGCNNYFVPIHTQPYVMEALGTKPGDFPITERIAARTIALPFFANMSEKQVGRVKDVLTAAIGLNA